MNPLTLEMELLTGAYRAALPDGSSAEWPPHPERVFSALAQAWADGGKLGSETAALEWLEAVAPPTIEADSKEAVSIRTAPDVFVPPNDFEIPARSFSWPTDKWGSPKPIGDIAWAGIEPTIRATSFRQPRHFQVSVPTIPFVRMTWGDEPPPRVREALGSLAFRVSSLGHSASLVRMAVVSAALDPARLWQPIDDGDVALRTTYPQRLTDLERWFEAGQRPRPRSAQRYRAPRMPAAPLARESAFGSDWLVFEGVGGFQPDVLGIAHIARRVRDSLMATSPIQPTPEIISGHAPEGGPSRAPHLAIVPLLDAGWPYSGGELLGFALVIPRNIDDAARSAFLRAVAAFAPPNADDEFTAELRLSADKTWNLQRSAAPSRASLKTGRWCTASTSWMSVTPMILDRYPDDDDPIEAAQIVAASCTNLGLPTPVQIELQKHSGARGAPAAYPARGSRTRPDWSFPRDSKLRDRPRRHVVLRFAEPVRGPVILGAGRYQGFGLCLPFDESNR